MFKLDFDWISLAVLTFSFIFDPRLALVVFWTYVEFMFQVKQQCLKDHTHLIELDYISCANLCFVGGMIHII